MKRMLELKLLFLLAFLVAFALPAMAEVNVLVNIYKHKDLYVEETINISKDIYIFSTVTATPTGAAEAKALVNQLNEDNSVNPGEVPDKTNFLANISKARIVDSIIDNTGIVNVNQNTGNMNNQGNAIAFGQTENDAFTDAESVVDQVTDGNISYASRLFNLNTYDKEAVLHRSMHDNTGIMSANQTVGNMNNQGNAVSMAVSVDGALVALAEADLGQVITDNQVWEWNTNKWDRIVDSINNNVGVTNFNQSSGNMNNQANVVSLSVTAQ